MFTRAAAYAIEGKVLGHSKDGEPAVVDRPAETEAMLAATALSRRDRLLASATAMMDPLQDAVDIGDSTEAEEAELVAWKRYRVQLKRVEQQPGFPTVIEWPSRPEEVSP